MKRRNPKVVKQSWTATSPVDPLKQDGGDGPPRSRIRRLVSTDFRLYQVVRFLATIGIQMQAVAVGWQVYEMTEKPFDLGIVGLVQFIPAISLVLFTGHFADRYDRKKILFLTHAAFAACAALLCYFSLSGVKTPDPIYMTLFLFGVTRAFAGPAATSLLPHLVPKEQLSRAIALNSSTWQFATILGPAMGGLLYGAFGSAGGVYAISAGCLVVSTACLARMKVRTGRSDQNASSWKRLFVGISFVRREPVVLGALTLDLFACLLGGATALLPVFAKDILHVGPTGLGLLRTAPAVGAVLTALWLGRRPLEKSAGRVLFGSVAVYGVATIIFGLSHSFYLSLAALFVLGAADMISVVVRHTVIQFRTPEDMRGKVSAVSQVFIISSNELGEFESGITAAWWGVVPAVVVGGVGALVVTVLLGWRFPELRDVSRFDGSKAKTA